MSVNQTKTDDKMYYGYNPRNSIITDEDCCICLDNTDTKYKCCKCSGITCIKCIKKMMKYKPITCGIGAFSIKCGICRMEGIYEETDASFIEMVGMKFVFNMWKQIKDDRLTNLHPEEYVPIMTKYTDYTYYNDDYITTEDNTYDMLEFMRIGINDEVFIQDKGYISGEEDEEFDSDFESLLINPRRIGRDVNHTHSDIDTSESENDTSDSENDTSESENDMSDSESRVILNQDGSPYMIGTDDQESDDDSIIGRDGDIGFRRDCYFWGNDDELYYIDNSGVIYLEEDTGIDRELKFNRKILYESDNIIYDTIVDVKRLLFIDSDDEREYRDYEGVIENYTRIMSIKVGYITIEIDIIINTINIDILDELQKNLLNDFKDIVKVSYEFNEVSAYYTSPVEHSYGLDRVMKLEMNVKEHRDNIFRVCEYLLMYVRD